MGSAPRAAIMRATAGEAANSLAAGAKNCPAQPPKGRNAPLNETSARGARCPSRAMRARMAAPAEWPAARAGATSSAAISSPSALAMAGRAKPAALGAEVCPWPGRSGTITLKRRARAGISRRQEWAEAAVPCSSSRAGPLPASTTCQVSPAASTWRDDRLADAAVDPECENSILLANDKNGARAGNMGNAGHRFEKVETGPGRAPLMGVA